MKTNDTSDVRSSSVQVGCKRTDGIIGTSREPTIQPTTSAPNLDERILVNERQLDMFCGHNVDYFHEIFTYPVIEALTTFFILSLRK